MVIVRRAAGQPASIGLFFGIKIAIASVAPPCLDATFPTRLLDTRDQQLSRGALVPREVGEIISNELGPERWRSLLEIARERLRYGLFAPRAHRGDLCDEAHGGGGSSFQVSVGA